MKVKATIAGKIREYNSFSEWYKDYKETVIEPTLLNPYYINNESLKKRDYQIKEIIKNIEMMIVHFNLDPPFIENFNISIGVDL